MDRRAAPLYSIGVVARTTRIPAATIRNWEERYGLIAAERGPGGQRRYSEEQIEQLRRIRADVEAGIRPGDAHRALATRGETARRSYPHVCVLVHDAAEERAFVTPHVLDALRRRGYVLYIHAPGRSDQVMGWLGKAGRKARDAGRLELRDWFDTYLRGGTFDGESMLATVPDVTARARSVGADRMLIVGEMGWVDVDADADPHALIEYERRVTDALAAEGVAGMCVYPLERMTARVVLDLVSVHPIVAADGRVHDSPFFVPVS